MQKDRVVVRLVEIIAQMRELCGVLRHNAVLSKNTGLLLKHHTAQVNALFIERGMEKVPDLIEENSLLIEQNVNLLEQHAIDMTCLLRLQEKVDAIHAGHTDVKHKAAAAQMPGAGRMCVEVNEPEHQQLEHVIVKNNCESAAAVPLAVKRFRKGLPRQLR